MKQFLFRQKYRFDLGQSFLTLVSFAFIVIAASDKIESVTGWQARRSVLFLVPVAMSGVWLLGYVLDRFMQMGQRYKREENARNEDMQAILAEIRKLSR